MKKLFCFVIPVLMITSGCCFNSNSPKTEYFTINFPSTHAKYNYHIEIAPLAANELYGSKMVFFKEPNSIFFDNFNLWAQSPNKMLVSYFNIYFNNPASPIMEKDFIPIRFEAVILKFECNLTQKECLLSLALTAKNTSDEKILFSEIYIEKVQMNKLTAVSFASSMSKAVKAVAARIENTINNIYKNNNLKKGKQ
jgi:hypothetical protein